MKVIKNDKKHTPILFSDLHYKYYLTDGDKELDVLPYQFSFTMKMNSTYLTLYAIEIKLRDFS